MANACQHPDQPGYQVADPQSGNGLCSHATIEDAVACAAASNRVRPLMNGEKAADSWLFVRATPGPACHACGHPKAA